MKIFLIGYMGSGKSSTGRKLARKLGYRFIDMDLEFERVYSVKLGDYINTHGETAFRARERDLLEILAHDPGEAIIATGGGTPCFFDNMGLINKSGLSVYLEMHPRSLAQRLEASLNERPLLKGLKDEDLLGKIEKHLEERRPFYNKANIKIKGESLDMEELVRKIKDNIA